MHRIVSNTWTRSAGALLLGTAVLTGCHATGEKQAAGGIIGGALGGLLGAQVGKGSGQVAAAAVGAIAGLLLGSSIGESLDDVDRMRHRETATRALEHGRSGEQVGWHNPDNGNHGSVTPTRTYRQPDGSPCREFTQTIVVAGRAEQAVGQACRQPDGTWRVMS